MKKIVLTLEEFEDYEIESIIASESSTGRRLLVYTKPFSNSIRYVVKDRHAGLNYEFSTLAEAVEQFNEL